MIEKIRNARRSRLFYYKLISYTLVLSLLPILMIGLVLYHTAKTSLKTELQTANANYLSQTASALEIVIGQISQSFEQFALNSTIRDFEKFPRGRYYEQIKGEIADIDLPFLERYISAKTKVRLSLDNMKLSNDYIDSVSFVDREKNITLTSVGSPFTEEEANAQTWTRLPDSVDSFPYFMEIHAIRTGEGATKQLLPVIYMSANINSYVIVNLDADRLYADIINKLDNGGETTFFVLSGSGTLLLHNGQDELYQRIRARMATVSPSSGPLPPAIIPYNGKKMLVTYQTSARLGWTVVRSVDLDGLYRSISHIKGLIFLTSFLLIAVMGLLSLMTSRSIYHPMIRLLAYIKSVDRPERSLPFAKHMDEFNTIRTRFAEAVEDRTSLQIRLKESLPAYKEKFLTTVVMNNRLSRAELLERMQMLGLRFQLEDLMLLCVYIDDQQQKKADLTCKNMAKLRIHDRLERIVALRSGGFVAEMAEDLFTVVVNGTAAATMDIFALAEEIRDALKHEPGADCIVGIGRHCPDVYQLRRACDEAKEAIGHRNVGETGTIIHIDDVRLGNKPVFVYPKDAEATLLSYVKNGEAIQAKLALREFTSDLKSRQEQPHYHQVQQAFGQLLAALIDTANNIRIDPAKLSTLTTQPYAVLLQKKDLEETVAWFECLLEEMVGYIETAFKEKKSRHIREAVKLIEENDGQELSLTAAADRLDLNPSYLSRIFKEKTGTGFMEFVTNARIEKSKKLLHETNMKVKDIGELLGYANVNYYIRIFKEVTGTTPREYRKKFGGQE
ncbi:MAG: helix-turn-helix domain-containing protein [Paenibacillaceae bacterium]|nr:helix-turn-helix domain-containing protein [Paenibacillaceae bacterium]